jgi:transposase
MRQNWLERHRLGRPKGVKTIDRIDQLVERITKNLSDYHSHIKGFEKKQIIDMAGHINAMNDAHFYLTEHHAFDYEQAEYLLQFKNPLEIVADKWEQRISDISDMSFDLDNIFDKRDAEQNGYALAGAGVSKTERHRPVDSKDESQKPSILSRLADAKKDAMAQAQPSSDKNKHAERMDR